MKRIRRTSNATLVLAAALGAACVTPGGGGANEPTSSNVDRVRPGGATTLAPYTPAVRAGGFVFFSGQIGMRPGGGGLPGTVAEQTEQALRNLEQLMDATDVEREDIVKCTVFLADIRDYAEMNEAYGRFFGERPPARSAVGVAGLPAGARVEIECMAADV